ncbi:MAG TPA: hypothetical protein DF480_00245 [Clostridiales bacterium]|nr:hypothetical protein [Clostridiales bacterium]
MKKRRFASIGIILSLLLTAATPVSAVPVIEPDPDAMAVYINNDFNALTGSSGVEGDLYTANGSIAFSGRTFCTGTIFHKTGTSYTYPLYGTDFYEVNYSEYAYKDSELSDTAYEATFPSIAAFPAIGNYMANQSNNKAIVIDQDTHFGTLDITKSKSVTFNTNASDLHIVINTLNITSWIEMQVTGANKLYLYINDYTGTQPVLIRNASENPDQVYIVAHDYLPLHATIPFYGHVIYTGITNIVSPSNFSIIGSLVTDASTVSLPNNDAITGLLYAPDAAVSLGGSSNITGRLVADSLSIPGSNVRITYGSLYATFDLPAELIEAPPEIHTVNAAVSPIGAGTVTPTYAEALDGETIHLTVTPADGFMFTGFTSSDPSMVPDAGGNVTVTGNVTITAHFEILGLDPNYTNGLLGEYYDESNLQNESALRMRRIDPRIAFNFGYEPPDEVIEPEDYSIRWTGYIRPTISGSYSFNTYSDDGVRVSVNDTMVIDNWGFLSLAYSESDAPIYLQAGTYYPITVEYQQKPLYAAVFLFWEAESVPMGLVPEANLFVQQDVYTSYATPQYYNLLQKTGTGLQTAFHEVDWNGDIAAEAAHTTVAAIDYDWGMDAPEGIATDRFYGEMDGYVEAKFTEDTTLVFTVDDALKVWLNDVLVIDTWTWNSKEAYEYTFSAEVGVKYKLHIEYMEMGIAASITMGWHGEALGSEIIPARYLYEPID